LFQGWFAKNLAMTRKRATPNQTLAEFATAADSIDAPSFQNKNPGSERNP